MLYRTDFTHPEWFHRWRRALNAVFLTDLANCQSGYSPTHWQRSLFPKEYQPKIRAHFDGIDTTIFRPLLGHAAIDWLDLPKGARVVTYVSRGFESMRGFDIFMKVAKRIYTAYPKVIFVVPGLERVAYSNDPRLFGQASFKKWVLKQDSYDLSKFRFVGWVSPSRLAQLFNLSTLHIYLTTPFPLSWSCFSALACGATVLASDTEPVREVIEHGRNGLLAQFFDVAELAHQALQVLRSPAKYSALGRNAAEHIEKTYAAPVTVPRLVEYFEEIATVRLCKGEPAVVKERDIDPAEETGCDSYDGVT
jgi:glycosyltransferase involved in cell wall biosynthesis